MSPPRCCTICLKPTHHQLLRPLHCYHHHQMQPPTTITTVFNFANNFNFNNTFNHWHPHYRLSYLHLHPKSIVDHQITITR